VTTTQIIEVAAAAMLLGAGAWLYRRRGAEPGGYGSQSAVILLVIGLIVAIHGLGLLEYRPMGSER